MRGTSNTNIHGQRLFLIVRPDGTLALKYLDISKRDHCGPSRKGYRQMGEWRRWYAIDQLAPEELAPFLSETEERK